MEDQFSKLKSEAAKIEIPDECEENDRAVQFLALETGVGHYDNLNLLVLSVLMIFIAVSFLAVSGGKIRSDEELSLTKESFLSGEFEQGIEKRYLRDLPIPEQMRAAEEHISFLYGIGNTISEIGSGSYDIRSGRQQGNEEYNPFDNEDERDENAVTTKAVMTDKDGNTVTEADSDETAPGGGTTAVSRPASTYKTYTTPSVDEEMTTTNNEPPLVTVTTTVISNNTETSQDTEDSSEPSDTEPPVTEEPDSKPDTDPSDTASPPDIPEE